MIVLPFLLLAASPAAAPHPQLPQPSPLSSRKGAWEAPFNHDVTGFNPLPPGFVFEAIHMALIPKGPNRGKVIVWDAGGNPPQGGSFVQRWSIVDPAAPGGPAFQNFNLQLPGGGGDLFCSAHAWTANGDLFVAGGTSTYPTAGALHPGQFHGAIHSLLYDPSAGPNGSWIPQADMATERWYPGVVRIGNGQILVLGGTNDSALPTLNNYEAFDPATGTWQSSGTTRIFAGPPASASPLDAYPRQHLLSTGQVFVSGMGGWSSRLDHLAGPGTWTPAAATSVDYRSYGTSVLFPSVNGIQDVVMILGGEGYRFGQDIGTLASVEYAFGSGAGAPAWNWIPAPPLETARMHLNAVLLPDGGILAVGGRRTRWGNPNPKFTRTPELFSLRTGRWTKMARAASVREYHSTAVLLPDGRVLSAGGDYRQWDYQVFDPPYLTSGGFRPVINGAPAVLSYYSADPVSHTVTFDKVPPGTLVGKVVLMAPGSLTHHSDFGQRLVEMPVVARTRKSITFLTPFDSNAAPQGWYMLFLVTRDGVPSKASWVRLQ